MAKLLVIVGETATGKSALAMELAERLNGEIICADSRTVYRGMDISTAKPSTADQARVRHHLIDLVEPGQRFTAADFKRLAEQAIDDITARSKLPIVVGGTGLYVDALLYDYQFGDQPATGLREELSGKSVAELQDRVVAAGLELPGNRQNPRHLIRTLETGGRAGQRGDLRPGTLILGLKVDREVLKQRVAGRAEAMLKAGLVDEIRRLGERYGWASEAVKIPACKAFRGYIEGSETLAEAKQKLIKNDLDLAKRQRTWFKRNKSIHWFANPVNLDNVVEFVTTHLDK